MKDSGAVKAHEDCSYKNMDAKMRVTESCFYIIKFLHECIRPGYISTRGQLPNQKILYGFLESDPRFLVPRHALIRSFLAPNLGPDVY